MSFYQLLPSITAASKNAACRNDLWTISQPRHVLVRIHVRRRIAWHSSADTVLSVTIKAEDALEILSPPSSALLPETELLVSVT